MSGIERERIRRRVAAALKGEEYSIIEMAYDLERLATHPVWKQADRCASELEGAVDRIAELERTVEHLTGELKRCADDGRTLYARGVAAGRAAGGQ